MHDESVDGNTLFSYKCSKWTLIVSFLGNDYSKSMSNVGLATAFKKVLPKLVSQDVDNAIKKCNYDLRYEITQ